MSTFTVSLWVEIEADCHEDAWKIAESLTLYQSGLTGDMGIIDVEEIEE